MSTVAVLGATPKPERFANKAIKLLRQHGHDVIPVHPKLSEVEGLDVAPSLSAITDKVDTLTLYVGPARLEPMIDEIIALKPGRVIFNPGTETPSVQAALDEAGIPWQEDCTLILLNNNRF
jgi:predicted CoA-binding protein